MNLKHYPLLCHLAGSKFFKFNIFKYLKLIVASHSTIIRRCMTWLEELKRLKLCHDIDTYKYVSAHVCLLSMYLLQCRSALQLYSKHIKQNWRSQNSQKINQGFLSPVQFNFSAPATKFMTACLVLHTCFHY